MPGRRWHWVGGSFVVLHSQTNTIVADSPHIFKDNTDWDAALCCAGGSTTTSQSLPLQASLAQIRLHNTTCMPPPG